MKLYLQKLPDNILNDIKAQFLSEKVHVHFRKYKSRGYIYFHKNNLNKVSTILSNNIPPNTDLHLPILTNCQANLSPQSADPILIDSASCDINVNGNTLSDYGFYYYYLHSQNQNLIGLTPTQISLYNVPNSLVDGKITISNYQIDTGTDAALIFIQGYSCTNNIYSYSEMTSAYKSQICLSENTLITLFDGTQKNIADISYEDDLLVWDFDNAKLSSAKPLWIKKTETTSSYNLLEFSDGSFLETIGHHRIFNVEKGQFTCPIIGDIPVDTTTFTSSGQYVKLINNKIMNGSLKYYNIITKYHINLFANSILTSCRYNNIYPIENMKFIKKNINSREYNGSNEIPQCYIDGLRLNEQSITLDETIKYVKRLELNKLIY